MLENLYFMKREKRDLKFIHSLENVEVKIWETVLKMLEINLDFVTECAELEKQLLTSLYFDRKQLWL